MSLSLLSHVRVCLFLLSFVALESCEAASKNDSGSGVALYFETANAQRSPEIMAEVVATPSEREQGLMYRRDLAELSGMLFIFPVEEVRQFWMKNTYLELDIIFVNEALRVVSIAERATPHTTVHRVSDQPAKYVLEVGGGQCKKWGITAGSKMVVQGSLPPAS